MAEHQIGRAADRLLHRRMPSIPTAIFIDGLKHGRDRESFLERVDGSMRKSGVSRLCGVWLLAANRDHELELTGCVGFDLVETAAGFRWMQIDGRISRETSMKGGCYASTVLLARRTHENEIAFWP